MLEVFYDRSILFRTLFEFIIYIKIILYQKIKD